MTTTERTGRDPGIMRRVERLSWLDSGNGPAVLLLNGWSASSIAWPRRFIDELNSGFRVVRPDNRGAGWSRNAFMPYTMAELAGDAAAVLRYLDIDRATVVGLSMGGMIAQELTLRHPALVHSLVLVASSPPAPARALDMSMAALFLRRPRRKESLRAYFERMWADASAPGFAAADPEAIGELANQTLQRPTPRAALFAQLRAVSGWYGAERLQSITAPTFVVHGQLDRLSPVRNGMRLAHLIPGARYEELPGVGHLVPLEAERQLIDIILAATRQPERNLDLKS